MICCEIRCSKNPSSKNYFLYFYVCSTSFFTDNRNVTFSLVDVTGTSGMDEWIRGDPFSQTRVGNETNPFVENVDVAVQEVYDDELRFSETKVIQYFAMCTHVNNSYNNNKIISLCTSHIEVYSHSEVYCFLGV